MLAAARRRRPEPPLVFFHADADADADYIELRWTCLTILWSATATSLGSSTTGMIRTFYPQINELLLLTIKPYPDNPPPHQGRCRGKGPLRKPFSKQKPSGTHQFILQIGNVTKMEQVRKLTANEMTCELPNGRQPSNLGVRLQPSKSQVDLIACPTTSSMFK